VRSLSATGQEYGRRVPRHAPAPAAL